MCFLCSSLKSFESPQKFREIVYLLENGRKEEALKILESPVPEKKELSDAVFLLSIHLYKAGERSYAKKFLKKALEMNPYNWRGWSFLSFLELKRGNIHLFFKYLPRTFSSFLKDFNNQVIIFSILLKAFYISVLVSFFILSVFLFIKYLPLVGDDFSRLIGEIAYKSGKFMSYFLILLLPALLFLGWGLTAIFLIAFVWSFLKNKERRLVIVAISAFILGIMCNNISTSLSEEINKSLSSSDLHPKNAVYSLINVKRSIERGEFEKAINILEDINSTNPDLFSLITLGNIRLKEGKYEESRKLYEKALMLYPHSNIPYSNLSILFEKTGEINYAEKYKEKAKALKGKTEGLIWPEINFIHAWKSILREKSKNILSSELLFVFGIILSGVLINILLKLFPALYGESRFCLSCGKSINIHFDLKITNPDYCEECYRLFVWKPPELEIVRASKSKEIKMKKLKEMEIYRLISFLIPGSGLIRYEKPSLQYAVLTIFVFSLSAGLLLKKIEPFSISLTFALISIVTYIISIFIFEKRVREKWKEL